MLSINDVKRLVKQKLYWLETGSQPGDSLIYDSRTRKYVGHIEGGRNTFHQDSQYIVPPYIVSYLETFKGEDWNNGSAW
jgi:hypothetical protein